jgi:uncharacterized protein YdeI (YjbR/CyaY-like superfamily)
MTNPQADALAFESLKDLAGWLAEHHANSGELWVRIYKANSRQRSVTWADCVVEAIRFGWVDGLKRTSDDRSYLQRLTPRQAGSSWSNKNREHADRLIAEGRMPLPALPMSRPRELMDAGMPPTRVRPRWSYRKTSWRR